MSNLSRAKGKAAWALGECYDAEADALRAASAAVKEIGEAENATRYANLANEKETAAVQKFAEAKELGYYGENA